MSVSIVSVARACSCRRECIHVSQCCNVGPWIHYVSSEWYLYIVCDSFLFLCIAHLLFPFCVYVGCIFVVPLLVCSEIMFVQNRSSLGVDPCICANPEFTLKAHNALFVSIESNQYNVVCVVLSVVVFNLLHPDGKGP